MNIKVLSLQSQTLLFSTVIKGLRYSYLWTNAACKLECRLFLCSKVSMAQSRHRTIICISLQLSLYVSQVNHKFLNVKTLKESTLPTSGIASQSIYGQLMLRSSAGVQAQVCNACSSVIAEVNSAA